MGYEIFTKKVQYRGSPGISLTKMGIVAFNKGSAAMLQKDAIEHVLLLWDKDKRMIGIRSITKKDPRSYKVRMNTRGDGASFSALTFLKYIEYDISTTRTFPANWNEQQQMFEIQVPEEYFKKDALATTSNTSSKTEDVKSNKVHMCTECGRICKDAFGLRNHRRLAHGIKTLTI
jgi:hypothetical protein